MFTLEESTLLRRMLHAVMWGVIALVLVGMFLLLSPLM